MNTNSLQDNSESDPHFNSFRGDQFYPLFHQPGLNSHQSLHPSTNPNRDQSITFHQASDTVPSQELTPFLSPYAYTPSSSREPSPPNHIISELVYCHNKPNKKQSQRRSMNQNGQSQSNNQTRNHKGPLLKSAQIHYSNHIKPSHVQNDRVLQGRNPNNVNQPSPIPLVSYPSSTSNSSLGSTGEAGVYYCQQDSQVPSFLKDSGTLGGTVGNNLAYQIIDSYSQTIMSKPVSRQFSQFNPPIQANQSKEANIKAHRYSQSRHKVKAKSTSMSSEGAKMTPVIKDFSKVHQTSKKTPISLNSLNERKSQAESVNLIDAMGQAYEAKQAPPSSSLSAMLEFTANMVKRLCDRHEERNRKALIGNAQQVNNVGIKNQSERDSHNFSKAITNSQQTSLQQNPNSLISQRQFITPQKSVIMQEMTPSSLFPFHHRQASILTTNRLNESSEPYQKCRKMKQDYIRESLQVVEEDRRRYEVGMDEQYHQRQPIYQTNSQSDSLKQARPTSSFQRTSTHESSNQKTQSLSVPKNSGVITLNFLSSITPKTKVIKYQVHGTTGKYWEEQTYFPTDDKPLKQIRFDTCNRSPKRSQPKSNQLLNNSSLTNNQPILTQTLPKAKLFPQNQYPKQRHVKESLTLSSSSYGTIDMDKSSHQASAELTIKRSSNPSAKTSVSLQKGDILSSSHITPTKRHSVSNKSKPQSQSKLKADVLFVLEPEGQLKQTRTVSHKHSYFAENFKNCKKALLTTPGSGPFSFVQTFSGSGCSKAHQKINDSRPHSSLSERKQDELNRPCLVAGPSIELDQRQNASDQKNIGKRSITAMSYSRPILPLPFSTLGVEDTSKIDSLAIKVSDKWKPYQTQKDKSAGLAAPQGNDVSRLYQLMGQNDGKSSGMCLSGASLQAQTARPSQLNSFRAPLERGKIYEQIISRYSTAKLIAMGTKRQKS